jgi:hypothetical protein
MGAKVPRYDDNVPAAEHHQIDVEQAGGARRRLDLIGDGDWKPVL